MANNSQKNLSAWDRVVAWYASKAYGVQMVYSIGASIVIVGALFKILHWPGASYVLMVGMFTESFLFLIGIFEKPHVTYHWENVFPQLLGDEAKEVTGGGFAGNNLNIGTSPVAVQEQAPVLSDSEMKTLKDGMAGLSKAAAQLTELSQVATSSNKLSEQMQSATQAVGAFAQSQHALSGSAQQLGQAYAAINQNVASAVKDSESFANAAQDVKVNVASLNASYELQLKAAEAQAKAFAAMSADTDKMAQAIASGVKASAAYAQNADKLASQVADLNKVYGNMLNALA